MDAAAAADATLVVMDNLYAYGPTEGRPSRRSAQRGDGRDRPDARLHGSGSSRPTQPGGPGYHPTGVRLLRPARPRVGDGRAGLPLIAGKAAQVLGNPSTPHTYAYVPDIAKGLVTLGAHEEALGGVWHLPHSETTTTRDFIERIANALGVTARVQAMPKPLARLLGLFNGDVRELIELWYEFNQPFVVDDSKFRRAFDATATPLDEAIGRTAAWFRAHPQRG